jgi:uncharacterized protein (TIRG00374 family)
MNKLAARWGIGIGLGAIVYLGLVIYAGWDELRATLALFRWPMLIPVLALSLANYLLRFVRWHLYLQRSNVRLAAWPSLRIFFSGLVMSVTPGKLGELLKAYLVRTETGAAVAQTGPIVIAERVTDLLALVVLLFIGSAIEGRGWMELALSGGITAILIAALASATLARFALHLVGKIPGLHRFGDRLEHAYRSMRALLRPRLLLEATVLGTFAWFAECLGLALVADGFGAAIGVARATFVYSFATLVGALLLLPGGLGGTEGSMIAFLVGDGLARPRAVGVTFLTRIATLWFAVLLGALVLLGFRRARLGDQSLA